jgi:hypothetical protein
MPAPQRRIGSVSSGPVGAGIAAVRSADHRSLTLLLVLPALALLLPLFALPLIGHRRY